jgi:hypothetical protein
MSDNHRRRRPLARPVRHPGVTGRGRGLDRRPASRLHPPVRMALPADQLSRDPLLKTLDTYPWTVPQQMGKPTTPEPGDLHAARRLTTLLPIVPNRQPESSRARANTRVMNAGWTRSAGCGWHPEPVVLRRFPRQVIGGTSGARIAAWWRCQVVSAGRRAGRGAAAAGWLRSSARRWR